LTLTYKIDVDAMLNGLFARVSPTTARTALLNAVIYVSSEFTQMGLTVVPLSVASPVCVAASRVGLRHLDDEVEVY
jgi:hypothetical protein